MGSGEAPGLKQESKPRGSALARIRAIFMRLSSVPPAPPRVRQILRSPTEIQSSAANQDYVQRVNRALDYVLAHLDEPLPLEAVAQAAGFSPFHFHRIFRAALGETLNQFVKRVRLERAVRLMAHGPTRTLTEVALECGFQSSSDFSRCFKQRYGVPPSAFDARLFREQRREEWQAVVEGSEGARLDRLPPGENPDGFEVELVDLPARTVAYTRVLDPYRPDVARQACMDMLAWAEERGLADGQWLGYQWDDPEIVAHADCRYDVGLVVERCAPEGVIGCIEFAPMRVAQLELRGGIELVMRALDWLWGTWLPNSAYAPSDQPAFEAWIGRPFAHGEEHFEIHAQLPLIPRLGGPTRASKGEASPNPQA